MTIKIKIEGKRASVIDAPIIVCGNSDYSIEFDFDAEWNGAAVKTARFAYAQGGVAKYQDVVFTGNVARVPILTNTREVLIGVYAGDLQTTTPAKINCKRSILCGSGTPDDPEPDAYRQLLSFVNSIETSLVVSDAHGEVVRVDDSSDCLLRGLHIYGKTTQDGTPTPEAPVELVSAGASGAIKTIVAGKNLLGRDGTNITDGHTAAGLTFNENGDGTFRVNGTCTSAFVRNIGDVTLPAGTYTISQANGTISYMSCQLWEVAEDGSLSNSKQVDTSTPKQTFTLTQTTKLRARFFANNGATPNNSTFKVQIEVGETATEWETPKTAQTLTAQTPNCLPGIPVSSGGNYTDENGQQWVCDEIDFARGVYVQRINEVDMGTRSVWWVAEVNQFFVDLPTGKYVKNVLNNSIAINAICSAYPVASYATHQNYDYVVSAPRDTGLNVRLNDIRYGAGQAAELKASLSGVKMIYELAEPIETALSAEELAAYAALHSNKPTTTVYTDAGADLAVEYVADTKNYIDHKFTELQNAILSAGANL